jgi:hypothetical protein
LLLVPCACRHARHGLSRRDVTGNDRACADKGARANADSPQDYDARAERGASLDDRALLLPINLALELARLVRRTRELVVDEERPVADEHFVVDFDTAADEGVTLDLAPGTDHDLALNFDKRANACLVADVTAVEIRKRTYDDALTECDFVDETVRRVVHRFLDHRQPPP